MADRVSSSKRSREGEGENENETTQPLTKRPRRDYNDTISVLVGSKEKCFTVHNDVICFRSKFFKAACSMSWKEGHERIVRLPTVKPCVFERYMDWIYFSEIASNVTGSLTTGLTELYLLGDMLDDINLRNETIAAFQVHHHKTGANPNTRQIRRIWENTTEGSTLRKWAIDVILLRSRRSFANGFAEYPPEFVQQIALKLMQQTSDMSATDFLAKTREYQEVDDEA